MSITATDNTSRSKRIALNSVVLFIRMFAIMAINLYAVRIVLSALGDIDYGVFNTIAGVVLTSSFLTSTLATSIQRFYSYAHGEGATMRLKQIFSASMNIILILCVIVLLILETVGLWFVNTQLTIPAELTTTVQWLYQFVILTLIFSFVQIPYNAAIFAREDMGVFAFISLLDCIGRLLVAVIISKWIIANHLLMYGAGLLVVAFIIFLAYSLYARTHYTECHYCRGTGKQLYKELLSFSGFTTYSSLAGISIIHGNTILLNIFFGPVATASYAIANQIHNALTALGNSIVIAFRPVMVKAYAEKNTSYLDSLFYVSNKFIFYLLLCASIPLIIEMPVILDWWLKASSVQMVLFSRCFVVFMLLFMLHNPITTIIHSTGQIKYYTLWVDSITMLCLPVTWLFYYLGAPDYYCFISMVVVYAAAHICRLICLRIYYPSFSYVAYATSLILPAIIVAFLSSLVAYSIHTSLDDSLIEFLAVSISTPLIVCLLAYFFGLTGKERHLLRSFAVQYINRKRI